MMNKILIRSLITCSIVSALCFLALEWFCSDSTLVEVRQYLYELESNEESVESTPIFIASACVVLVLFLISNIGLFLFKKWSRPLYVFSLLLSIPLYWPMGVIVSTTVGQLLNDVSLMAVGMILVLVYYSPASQLYKQTHDQVVTN